MGFAIKKLIWWCLSPLGLALILLGAGVVAGFTRRGRLGRGLTGVAFAVLLVFSLGPVADAVNGPLERRYPALMPPESLDRVAAVVVLGAGYDEAPGRPPTAWLRASGLESLVEGVRLLRLAPDSRLVVTGWGGGRDVSAAEVMSRAAVSLGVDRARIVCLGQPRDTAEEITAVRALVGERKVVIVTSLRHMSRTMELAARGGLDAIAAPAGAERTGSGAGLRAWMPSAEALLASTSALHEWIGWLWARRLGAPQPTLR